MWNSCEKACETHVKPMWNTREYALFTYVIGTSHVKFHMWFTREISHVKFHMWFTREISHVKCHMLKNTCEISHVKVICEISHVTFTCEISYVKFHMWNFTSEKQSHGKFHMWFSHVTLHMWNTCETHVDSTCVSHVKIIPCETHGIWESHVFLELHMCESHVSNMRNFCKGYSTWLIDNHLCSLPKWNFSQISSSYALGAVSETPDWGIIYPTSGNSVVTFSVLTFTA